MGKSNTVSVVPFIGTIDFSHGHSPMRNRDVENYRPPPSTSSTNWRATIYKLRFMTQILLQVSTCLFFAVRLGSKHNVRASILASSLCLDSASLRGGSIKSHLSCAGSVIAPSVSGRSLSEGRRPLSTGGPPSLVIHSSSGVSSGSTSSESNEDTKNTGPHSPTPSSSSSQGTVKRNPNSTSNSVISNGSKSQVRPRHLKQRKEVFKTPNINGETFFGTLSLTLSS